MLSQLIASAAPDALPPVVGVPLSAALLILWAWQGLANRDR